MEPTVKSSLLWGLIGALSYLVLIQAYHLTTGQFVGIREMAGVAVAVGMISAVLVHLLRPWIRKRTLDDSIE